MNAHRIIAWTGALLAGAVILIALFVSAFRLVVPHVPEYRDEVEAWASALLGAPVDISAMGLQWRGARPELILSDVRFVSEDARHAFSAREVRVGISIHSLARGRAAPARIVLVAPDLTIDFEAAEAGGGAGWRRTFAARQHRGEVFIENGRATIVSDSGRRRLDLEGVDARVASDGLNHSLQVTAHPGGVDGALNADFAARGWPGQRDWQVDGTVALRGLDLVAAQRFGRTGRLDAGRVDATAVVAVVGATQRVSAEIGLSGLRWRDEQAIRRIDRAVAEVAWQRRETTWRADLRRLVVATGGGVRESGPATVAFSPDGAPRVRVESGTVHLGDLAVFGEALPWVPTPVVGDWLVRNPRGVIRHASLSLERRDASWTGRVAASGLGLDARAGHRVPGGSGVSLTAELDDDGLTADFTFEDGELHFPMVFREAFSIPGARGTLHAVRTDRRWRFALADTTVANADLAAEGTASLEWAPGEEPQLQVGATLRDLRLDHAYPYLPVSVMSANLVAWLDDAVRAGRGASGRFSYDGPASGAALREGRARLEAVLDAHDVELAFAEGWPTVTDARTRLRFTEAGFSAQVDAGAVAGVPITGGTVEIARYLDRDLTVEAHSAAPLDQLLDAFRATPVGSAAWLEGVEAGGNSALGLRIALPLGEPGVEVAGTLELADARVAFPGLPHPVGNLRGTVRFSEDGVDAERVTGTLLGRALDGRVRTLRDGSGTARAVEVAVDGSADPEFISALVGAAELPVDGTTAWHTRVFVPYGTEHVPFMEIESSLEGLAIALPAPLGKPAAESRRVAVHADLLPGARRFNVDGGDALQAVGTLAVEDGAWRLVRGHVQVGQGDAAELPHEGVALTGRFDEWAFGRHTVLPGAAGTMPFTQVDVVIGQLDAFGRALGTTRATGERAPAGWSWALDGERVSGSVTVPDIPTVDAPIQALFDHLVLDAVAPREAGGDGIDAAQLPPVSFHASRFVVGPVSLGEVNGTLRPVENGVSLDGFSATRRELRIVGDATWHTVDGHHRTTVRANFDSNDVRRALAGLGYAASMDAAAGHLQFEVDWLGSPLDDPRPLMNGSLRVRMERGTLYEVQPGAGRMFGLLSVNALPRRLALDFSDVYRRGLAFDSITGTFRLADGDAYTDDLRLLGPAARVEIKGRTGIGRRDYDQEAVVVGSLASSLAIAGTLAGGPGVGAAMLIASEILRGPLEDMARMRYRVTGTWDQPIVERIAEPPR